MALTVVRTAFVLLALGTVAFCLVTARLAFRSQIRHRYWWTFVSLLGAPVFTLDWRGGWFTVKILAVQLLGAGFQTGVPGTPAWLAVAIPTGALLFRQRRRALMRAHRPMLADDQLPPADLA